MKNFIFILTAIVLTGISCNKGQDSLNSVSASNTGNGGSTSRFTIVGDYLYTINANVLKIYQITNSENPRHVSDIQLGQGVETIFPFKDKLLFGTGNGMLIYDMSNPEKPAYLSTYEHVVSCDPVVAQGNYAYVTLSTGTRCQRGQNSLDVVDISDFSKPELAGSTFMNVPKGLGVDGDKLLVCEGNSLTALDISNPVQPRAVSKVNISGLKDLIIDGDRAIVIGTNGLYQYYCNDISDMKLASVIAINP